MHGQRAQVPVVAEEAMAADARVCLLAEVDFKWLMAGEGKWIDTARFHTDPSYVADLLRWALASPSFALRACAALLQLQLGGPAPCNLERRPPDEYLF